MGRERRGERGGRRWDERKGEGQEGKGSQGMIRQWE